MSGSDAEKVVWRMERDGIGPYNNPHCAALADELLWAHCVMGEDTHPCAPTEFSRSRWISHTTSKYGMASEALLDRWFEGFEGKLSRNGFHKVEYRVSAGHWEESPRSGQVVYDARFATRV